MRFWVPSLASFSGLGIWCCCELPCRLQTRLGSLVTVAVVEAGSCRSDSTPNLGTSIYNGCGPKRQNKSKEAKKPLCPPHHLHKSWISILFHQRLLSGRRQQTRTLNMTNLLKHHLPSIISSHIFIFLNLPPQRPDSLFL